MLLRRQGGVGRVATDRLVPPDPALQFSGLGLHTSAAAQHHLSIFLQPATSDTFARTEGYNLLVRCQQASTDPCSAIEAIVCIRLTFSAKRPCQQSDSSVPCTMTEQALQDEHVG